MLAAAAAVASEVVVAAAVAVAFVPRASSSSAFPAWTFSAAAEVGAGVSLAFLTRFASLATRRRMRRRTAV